MGRKILFTTGRLFVAALFLITATAQAGNLAPQCSHAIATPDTLWPPNHKMSAITIDGVSDPDGDEVGIAVRCIMQDEPLNTNGDGNTEFDGEGLGDSTAWVRSERGGPPNGRVYHIDFIATDVHGAACSGSVQVQVPHNKKKPAVDDGRLYQSTQTPGQCDNQPINNDPVITSTRERSGQRGLFGAVQL